MDPFPPLIWDAHSMKEEMQTALDNAGFMSCLSMKSGLLYYSTLLELILI